MLYSLLAVSVGEAVGKGVATSCLSSFSNTTLSPRHCTSLSPALAPLPPLRWTFQLLRQL